MSRYIKFDDAIDYECPLNEIWENCIDCPLNDSEIEPCKMGRWLKSLLTIDIVRCQECKHGEYREDFDDYLCDQLGLGVVNDADFFCSAGERIDNQKPRTMLDCYKCKNYERESCVVCHYEERIDNE